MVGHSSLSRIPLLLAVLAVAGGSLTSCRYGDDGPGDPMPADPTAPGGGGSPGGEQPTTPPPETAPPLEPAPPAAPPPATPPAQPPEASPPPPAPPVAEPPPVAVPPPAPAPEPVPPVEVEPKLAPPEPSPPPGEEVPPEETPPPDDPSGPPVPDDPPSTDAPPDAAGPSAPQPEPPVDEPGPEEPISASDELREVEAVVLSSQSAAILWRSALPGDSEVRYGKTSDLELKPILQPQSLRRHRVVLTGLSPGTRYYFQAASASTRGVAASEPGSFTTLAVEAYTVRSTHPRIFFTSEAIPGLQKRITGSHAYYWGKLASWCDSSVGTSTSDMVNADNGPMYARGMAFAACIGQKDAWRKKAEEMALYAASLSPSGNYPIRRNTLILTAVYDWLYNDLSATSRTTIRKAIAARLKALGTNDREWIWGWNPETFSVIILGALAIHGEDPDAAAHLQRCVDRYRDNILGSWRYYSRAGGTLEGWWYSTFHLDMLLDVFCGLRTATGLDLFQREPWLARLPGWFILGLRSDGSYPRSGDSKIFSGIHYTQRRLAVTVASAYGSGEAQWLADTVEGAIGAWGPTAVMDILYRDPSVKAAPPTGGLSRVHPDAGWAFVRDRWGPDSVQVAFRCASDFTMGHTHLDNNSFTIFYKAGLALDTGIYDEFSSDHHRNYYERTIAHNSMLVIDPDEAFRRYSVVNEPDGGQRYLLAPEEVDTVIPGSVEEILNPASGYQCGGLAYHEDTPDYTYSMGDATFSYSATKLKAFQRHFLVLKSVVGFSKPVVLVFDRVVATKSSFRKAYLLHTQEKPVVQGARLQATNGAGTLFQQTVFPLEADIQIIGGPGKEFWVNGTNWAPTKTPTKLEEAGQYRVEISPSVSRSTDHFLHVLAPADAGAKAPPPASPLDLGSMKGAVVGDHVVLFPTGGGWVELAAYETDGVAPFHLLVGLEPLAAYAIHADNAPVVQAMTSYEGTLFFKAEGARSITVERSGAAAAP